MSMFQIFALIQDWYSGDHWLASSCLSAHTDMSLEEAHLYLEEHGPNGMTVLFQKVATDWTEEAPEILDNMVELRDFLDEIIRDLRDDIDERVPYQPPQRKAGV